MADNEHAAPSLGDSEMLAVQNPVGPLIPAVFQSREERPEVSSPARAKKPWNVLKQQPSGGQLAGQPHELPEEAGAGARKPGPLAGDGEVLAGEAADEEINIAGSASPNVPFGSRRVGLTAPSAWLYVSNISGSGHVGPVAGKDALAEGVELDLEGAPPAGALESSVEPADAGEH